MGDRNTADVKLQLLDEDGVQYEETDPLYLHSQVLAKSEFYETKISDRLTFDKKQLPMEINVRTSHSAGNYTKCIQLMYSSGRLSFSSVDEALSILPVACEIVFTDGIDQCMEYLDALPWTPVQEAKLRNLISSLDITVLPHLASRLNTSEYEYLNTMRENLEEMIEIMNNWPLYGHEREGRIYITAEKFVVDVINEKPTSDIAEICRSAIWKQFIDNVGNVIRLCNEDMTNFRSGQRIEQACFVLLWVVDVIQQCDMELFETVLKMFCEDSILSDKLLSMVALGSSKESKEAMIDILDMSIGRFIKAVANVEVILPASYRASLVRNWFSTLSSLISYTYTQNRFEGPLVEGMTLIAETLPLSEQETVFNLWNNFNPCRANEWWIQKELNHAYRSTSSKPCGRFRYIP